VWTFYYGIIFMSEYKRYMIIVFNGMNKLVGKTAVTSDRTTKD